MRYDRIGTELLSRERSRVAIRVELAAVASVGVMEAVWNVIGYENKLLIAEESFEDEEKVEVPLVSADIVLLDPRAV